MVERKDFQKDPIAGYRRHHNPPGGPKEDSRQNRVCAGNAVKKHFADTQDQLSKARFVLQNKLQDCFSNFEGSMGHEAPRETARSRKGWKWGRAENVVNHTLRGIFPLLSNKTKLFTQLCFSFFPLSSSISSNILRNW